MRRRIVVKRPRRLTDWISGGQQTEEEPIPDAGPGPPLIMSILSPLDLDEHNDRFTVTRIVGEVYFKCRRTATDDAVFVDWGIYKTLTDQVSDVIPLEPGTLIDADNEAWMFRRTSYLESNSDDVGAQMINRFYDAHIDIKVQRVLEGREAIVMVAAFGTATTSDPPLTQVARNLRCLVKLT